MLPTFNARPPHGKPGPIAVNMPTEWPYPFDETLAAVALDAVAGELAALTANDNAVMILLKINPNGTKKIATHSAQLATIPEQNDFSAPDVNDYDLILANWFGLGSCTVANITGALNAVTIT